MQHGREADEAKKRQWRQAQQQRNGNGGGENVENSGNKMAERCLLRVAQKLNGFEEGHVMSIQGQVNALLQQSRDPRRLCSLFKGWQAYL